MNRVLVIDDEPSIVELLEEILVCLGYRVKTARAAADGIQIFDREMFDMVITDIVMPDLDGHAVLQHIRSSERPFVPVMGISGTPWLLENKEFNCVLEKPFGVKTFADALEKMKTGAYCSKQAS